MRCRRAQCAHRAREARIATPKWGTKPYPADSYRHRAGAGIDPRVALEATSWGLGQIMGSNHVAAGYESAAEMVAAFLDSEERSLPRPWPSSGPTTSTTSCVTIAGPRSHGLQWRGLPEERLRHEVGGPVQVLGQDQGHAWSPPAPAVAAVIAALSLTRRRPSRCCRRCPPS